MISFHRDIKSIGNEKAYYKDFEWAPVAGFQRVAQAVTGFVWSPCRWQGGRRKGENFREAQLVGLDFDNGMMTLDQALNIFCDSAHIIGTTKSHQKDKGGVTCDRFRVVLKLERPVVDVAEYRATVEHYIDKYDCDSACKDGARFFWPCAEIISVADQGFLQAVIPPKPKEKRDYSLIREFKYVPRWIEQMLKFGVPDHTRNTACLKLGIYLTKCGFSEAEIVELIMRSPIPIGPSVRAEVEGAVANGAKRGRAEVESECEKEQAQSGAGRGEPLRAPVRETRSGGDEAGRTLPAQTTRREA